AHGQHIKLRPCGTSTRAARSRRSGARSGRLRRPHKNQPFAVRRPARRGVVLAVGHAARLLVAARAHAPDGGVISGPLFVHRHFYKRHPRAVRRNLRIANPVEVEDVFFGDRALLRLGKGGDGPNKTQRNDKNTAGTRHGDSLGETDFYITGKQSAVSNQHSAETFLAATWATT